MRIKVESNNPIKDLSLIVDAIADSLEDARITRGCSRDGSVFYTTIKCDEPAPELEENDSLL